LATIEERFAASGITTRYYTPQVHLASFALPRFILDIVEAARGDVDASRPDRTP
jgi:spermidine synthase